MLIIQKIEDLTFMYNDARYSVAKFLLENKRELDNYSMQEIADITFTSRSTLVRVAKMLGFSGWNEFISEYKDEVYFLDSHNNDADVNVPFLRGDDYFQIAGQINTVKRQSCEETLEFLDKQLIKQTIDLMKRASRICLFGVSVNVFLGQLFQHKMLQIGRNIEIINQSEMKYQAYSLKEYDCAIIISYSGNDENRLPTSLIKILKENKVPIISMTSMGENLLRRESNCVFTIASKEKINSKIASFASEASILFILDMIYSGYFLQDYDKNMDYKFKLSKKIEKLRYSTSKNIMEDNLK